MTHSKIFISKSIFPVSEIGYELHNTMLITCIYRFAWQQCPIYVMVTVHKMIYRVINVTRGESAVGLRDSHSDQFRLDTTFVKVARVSKVSLDGRQVVRANFPIHTPRSPRVRQFHLGSSFTRECSRQPPSVYVTEISNRCEFQEREREQSCNAFKVC